MGCAAGKNAVTQPAPTTQLWVWVAQLVKMRDQLEIESKPHRVTFVSGAQTAPPEVGVAFARWETQVGVKEGSHGWGSQVGDPAA